MWSGMKARTTGQMYRGRIYQSDMSCKMGAHGQGLAQTAATGTAISGQRGQIRAVIVSSYD
jgi:hypothetical protein